MFQSPRGSGGAVGHGSEVGGADVHSAELARIPDDVSGGRAIGRNVPVGRGRRGGARKSGPGSCRGGDPGVKASGGPGGMLARDGAQQLGNGGFEDGSTDQALHHSGVDVEWSEQTIGGLRRPKDLERVRWTTSRKFEPRFLYGKVFPTGGRAVTHDTDCHVST